jgi:hypothetical protein
MSVNGKFDDIRRTDLLTVADRFSVSRAEKILGEVKAVIENWTAHARAAGIQSSEADRVALDFRPL